MCNDRRAKWILYNYIFIRLFHFFGRFFFSNCVNFKLWNAWCVMSKRLKLNNNNNNQWMTVYPQRDSKIENKSSFAEWMVGLASQRVFVSNELKSNDNNLRLLFYLQKKFIIWFVWLFYHTICDWKAFFFLPLYLVLFFLEVHIYRFQAFRFIILFSMVFFVPFGLYCWPFTNGATL